MNLIRVKPLALLALMTGISSAQSAELGNMEINSGINQKLNADIPLNLTGNETTAGTRVKVLSSKVNSNTDSTTPEIAINSDDGKLKLTSKEAIHSPRIEIVLEVKSDKETQYKQFSIDLSRASEGSPLIVSPKNSLEKSQVTTVPAPKYYRKKSLTTPTATTPANSAKRTAVKTGTPAPKIIDQANSVNPPQLSPQPAPRVEASSITPEIQQAPAQSLNEAEIKQPTNPTPPPTVISPSKPKSSWIEENAFNLMAFLAGILGVLVLQKLFSPKEHKAKSATKPHHLANHEQYQRLQDSLAAEPEQQTRSNIASDVALFEELLRSRMQQLQETNPQQAQVSTSTNSQQPNELDDEDEFGFDFDLAEFAVEHSKHP